MRDASTSMEFAIFGRVALAALFGFLIGMEREYRGKSAGERTFALVAAGSAAFTAVGVVLFPASTEKVIAGVATGIGFLGAGIIWRREGQQARGLTTAASNWMIAAIGVIAGTGLYLTAALITVLALVILEVERLPIIGRLLHHPNGKQSKAPPPAP